METWKHGRRQGLPNGKTASPCSELKQVWWGVGEGLGFLWDHVFIKTSWFCELTGWVRKSQQPRSHPSWYLLEWKWHGALGISQSIVIWVILHIDKPKHSFGIRTLNRLMLLGRIHTPVHHSAFDMHDNNLGWANHELELMLQATKKEKKKSKSCRRPGLD